MFVAIKVVGLLLAVGGLLVYGKTNGISVFVAIAGIVLFVCGGVIEGFVVRGKKNKKE